PYRARLRAKGGRRTQRTAIPGTSSGQTRQTHPTARHTGDVFGPKAADTPNRTPSVALAGSVLGS
ncbi:MAG TPA: hypothetical protein VIM01_01495, partial [Dermatophilaceae bacterium]